MRNFQSVHAKDVCIWFLKSALYDFHFCDYAFDMNKKLPLMLIGGDLVIFVIFALGGRETHAPGDPNPLVNALPTLLTFVSVWVVIAAVSRVYRSDVMTNPRAALLRTLIAWLLAAPSAIVLRAVILGRTAIPALFVAVTIGLVGSLLLVWHGGVAWYLARRTARLSATRRV